MKSLLKFGFIASVVALAALITHSTGNAIAGFVAAAAVTALVERFTNFTILPEVSGAFCTPLVGLKRKCQSPTMGGAKRLYLILTEDLQTEFLTYDIAKTAGEFAGPIPYVTGKKFIEIEAWYDTTKFDTEMKLGAGFTQSIEFKVIGYDKDIVKMQTLLYEAPVNVVVQGNDDKLYWIGQKYIPMMFETKAVLPEKGTARKEVTFTAKQDGMQVPIFPLASTITLDVTALPASA